MKERHIIDDVFHKKLSEHTSPVSAGAFEGVMSKRGVVSAKKSFGGQMLWLLVAGLLLVGGGAYLSLGQKPISSENNIESASNNNTQAHGSGFEKALSAKNTDNSSVVSSELEPKADQDSANYEIENGRSGTLPKDQRTEALDPGLQTNNTAHSSHPEGGETLEQRGQNMAVQQNNTSPTINEGLLKIVSDKQQKEPSGQNILTGNIGSIDVAQAVGTNGSFIEPEGTVAKESSQSGVPTNGISKALASTSFDLNNFKLKDNRAERKTTELPKDLLYISIRPTYLNGTKPLSEPVSLSLTEALHGPKPYRLFTDVNAGYFTLSGGWVSGKNEGDLRESTETFTNAYSFGLRAGVQLKNDWAFSAGLIYNKLSAQVEFDKVRYDTTIQFNFIDTAIYNQNTQQWDSVIVAQIGSANSTTSTHLRTTNTYNTLQIPLSAGFHQKHGRFRFAVNAGLSFDLLLSKDALYPVLYRETSTAVIQEPSEEIATLQQGGSSIRSGISFFGNFSVSYLWTEKIHVFFEPTYRSATIPFKKGGAPYFKPNYLGVLGGVRYYF